MHKLLSLVIQTARNVLCTVIAARWAFRGISLTPHSHAVMVTLYMFWSVSATLTEEGRRVTTMAIPSSSTVVPSVRNTLGFDCLPSGTAPACLAAGSKARRISDSIQSVF